MESLPFDKTLMAPCDSVKLSSLFPVALIQQMTKCLSCMLINTGRDNGVIAIDDFLQFVNLHCSVLERSSPFFPVVESSKCISTAGILDGSAFEDRFVAISLPN